MNKKVSIIMPCYNHAKYVQEAILSALDQTYENIEIICVNDGSTDNSSEIMGEMARKYKEKILFIDNKQNKGVILSRNEAIDKCHGEYILPLDADDKIDKTYVEKASALLEANPDIGVVYSKACFFGSINMEFELPEFNDVEILFANCVPNSAMYRKEDYIHVGKYNKNMTNGLEDWDLWLSFVENGFKFYRIDEILYYHREYEEDSRNKLANRQFDDLYKQIVQNHLQLYINVVLAYHKEIKELKQVKHELEETRNSLTVEQSKVREAELNLNAIRTGLSFRIGRVITCIPRKLLGRP